MYFRGGEGLCMSNGVLSPIFLCDSLLQHQLLQYYYFSKLTLVWVYTKPVYIYNILLSHFQICVFKSLINLVILLFFYLLLSFLNAPNPLNLHFSNLAYVYIYINSHKSKNSFLFVFFHSFLFFFF